MMKWFIKIPGVEIGHWAPKHTWKQLFQLWRENGIEGIVIPVSLSDQLNGLFDKVQTLSETAKTYHLKSWLIFPVLNNSVYFYRSPDCRPVHKDQAEFEFPGWFTPICPSDENYRSYFREALNNLLTKIPVDTILLDYLRVPYFWEGWGSDLDQIHWPPFCYCNRCLSGFEAEYQKSFGDAEIDEWISWQGTLIHRWLELIEERIRSNNPFARIGVQILPIYLSSKIDLKTEWVGQNLNLLQKNADFFSPLIYDRLLNWSADQSLSVLVQMMTVQRLSVVPSFQISKIKWDRKKDESTSLTNLVHRIQPLNLSSATIFHARELISEKSIRYHLS